MSKSEKNKIEKEESTEKEFKLTDHFLVPKHEIITKEGKEKILDKLNVSEKQIPVILKSDPIVKEIKAKPGDMIRITRKSQVSGQIEYYRIVSK